MSSVVRARLPAISLALVALSGLGACSSPTTASSGPGGAGGALDSNGGAAGAGGAVPDGSTSGIHTEVPSGSTSPGTYLTSADARGSFGACTNTPLGTVLEAIRAADPTLADIDTIYNPATATSDGSFIYAYDVGSFGFDVIFKRGLGDCAAGCTENDYQYFSTDTTCDPVRVGHYHAAWGTGSCLTVDGAPMWMHPTPPDPLTVCGADNTPRDLTGTYGLRGTGQRMPCSVNAKLASAVDVTMKVVIAQDPADLTRGTVTFTYTGDALVDGVALPATFERSRFTAARVGDATPGACPPTASITAHYDFEGYQPGGLDATDFGDAACAACKGALDLALSLAGDVAVP